MEEKFTDDAIMTVLAVPRVFLPMVLKGCVQWDKENNDRRAYADNKR